MAFEDPHASTNNGPAPYPHTSSYPDVRSFQSLHSPDNFQTPNGMPPDLLAQARPGAPSNIRTDGAQQPQPIVDTVNSAFDNSTAAKQVDPDLIAQITEQVRNQVLDSLRGGGIVPPQQPPQPPKSSPPGPPFFQRSPTASTTASFPPRDVYTPPSPHRQNSSTGSSAPQSPSREQRSFSVREEMKSRSKEPLSDSDGVPEQRRRPNIQRRKTGEEETTLERIWQPLFDPEGQPTPRLGQFLRGLAIHIIEDYEPKHSIVITPAKMLQFYEDVRLLEETYQWDRIFGRQEYREIGRMYQDLNCRHHLVQLSLSEAPNVPALTPEGFQSWMTTMIQAYPEAEFERLAKAVLDMPISNADDCKERFPKELSRRLFPRHENYRARERCVAILGESSQPTSKASSFSMPPPPSHPPPDRERRIYGSSATGNGDNEPKPSFAERERRAYASSLGSDSSAAADGEDGSPPPMPIERERKPYSAKAGMGKTHDTDDTSSSTHSLRPEVNRPESTRHFRSNSSTGPVPISSSIPFNGRPAMPSMPSDGLSNSDYASASSTPRNLNRHASITGDPRRRGRSPTWSTGVGSNPYTRSAPQNITDIPSAYYTSNLPSNLSSQLDSDLNDIDSRSYRREPRRRGTEDERDSDRYIPREEYRKSTSSYGYGGFPPPPPRY